MRSVGWQMPQRSVLRARDVTYSIDVSLVTSRQDASDLQHRDEEQDEELQHPGGRPVLEVDQRQHSRSGHRHERLPLGNGG